MILVGLTAGHRLDTASALDEKEQRCASRERLDHPAVSRQQSRRRMRDVGAASRKAAVKLETPLAVGLGFARRILRLEPLYRIRFTYPESWMVSLAGGWEQHLFLAEGRCEGTISGRFRGANFPRRHGSDGPFRPDFRAVIETDDEALVMFEWHGYGRAYPPGRRQIVGAILHSSDAPQYGRLNDAVCVCVGEVRTPVDPAQPEPDLVLDVAELIWEPISD